MRIRRISIYTWSFLIVIIFSGLILGENNSVKTIYDLANDSGNESPVLRKKILCGDEICDPGENVYNCPEDCSQIPLSYSTTLINPRLQPGEQREFSINIKNIVDREIIVNIDVRGQILEIIKNLSDKVIIGPESDKTIDFFVLINKSIINYNLEGQIVFETENMKSVMPVAIKIIKEPTGQLDISVNLLSSSILSGESLEFQQKIYSLSKKEENISIKYFITSSDNNSYLLNWSEPKKIRGLDIEMKNVSLNSTFMKEGEYFLRVYAKGSNTTAFSVVGFEIYKPILTPGRIKAFTGIAIFVLVCSLILLVKNRYDKWKKERMRYLLPNFNLLPKKGERSFCIGKVPETTKKAYLDIDSFTTHALIAGSTGSGKSVSASVIIEEILLKNIPVIVFDPTCQWTGFVKQCIDKNLFKYYPEFGMKEDDARSFKGLIYTVKDPNISIDFKKYMVPGEITVFNLNSLKPGEYDQAVMHIIDKAFKIPWDESPELRLVMVFDEVHRLLEKYGGKGGYIALEKACREFRKWGIGLIMASQVNADFKQAVAGNILTEIQLNTKSMEDIKKVTQKYGADYSSKVARQGIGVAMIQNPKYNDGAPWFAQFRPTYHNPHKITEEELKEYSENSEKIDKFEAEIEKLKNRKIDISNLSLDLKLSREKLKEGHFKMVDIYLKSLAEEIGYQKKEVR